MWSTVHGTSTFTYDSNGNVTAINSDSYTWDYLNRLTQSSEGGVTVDYEYDHTGQRISKDNGTTTTIYASSLYEKNGATTTKHIYANDMLVASIEGTGTTTVFHNHLDHLNSTAVVSNSDGDQVEQLITYYPFGSERDNIQSGTHDQNNRFTGHDYDQETELSYLGARYYSGDRGQFLSQDPANLEAPEAFISDPQQLNTYSYARNNPLRLIDPDGRQTQEITAEKKRVMSEQIAQMQTQVQQIIQTIANGAVTGANTIADFTPVGDVSVLTTGHTLGGRPASGLDYGVAVLGVGGGPFVKGGTKAAQQLLKNKQVGDAFRDQVADFLKGQGKDVQTEVTKQTPFGRRVIDVEVRDRDGSVVGGVEAKTGNSRYLPSQRAKDAYLKSQGYVVDLIRRIGN